jgi:hypothetical protein
VVKGLARDTSCCEGKEGVGMQDEKVHVWFKTITKDVVSKI